MEVKEAFSMPHLMSIKKEMEGLVKCEELKNLDLRTPQPYFSSKCMEEARMSFRVQVQMVDCPGNMRGRYTGRMECEACLPWREMEGKEGVKATQSHLMECRAYSYLRVNRDMDSFSDIVKYFIDLKTVRTKV